MADLVPVTFEDGTTVYVEPTKSAVRPGQGGIQEAGVGAAERALDTAQQLSNSIKAFCSRVALSFHELKAAARPDKVTIEFGINVSAEGNVYIVKGTGEASIKLTTEWQFPEIDKDVQQ